MSAWVHNPDGDPIAGCVYVEDAAALVSVLGVGHSIRTRSGTMLWYEGGEGFPAIDSFDEVTSIAHERAAKAGQLEDLLLCDLR